MPLHVPVPPELTAATVWAYATKLLTNPAAAQDLLNMLVGISPTATGRAALLDNLANPQLLNLPNVKIMEHELGFSSIEALDSIAVVSTDTTELEITVTLPSGAHIVRAYLISLITAMNNTANVQTIDVAVKGRVAAGAWRTYFNQNNCMGVIPLIGATAYLTTLQNVGPTASVADDRIVTDANLSGDPPSGTFGFKCTIGQDSADEVRYTTQYVLIVTYRMS